MKNSLRYALLSSALVGCCAWTAPQGLFVSSVAAAETPVSQSDIDAVKRRIEALGAVAKLTITDGKVTEIAITEGSNLTDDDLELFAKLTDLTKLQILNCRSLNNNSVNKILGLKNLTSLSITNTVIDDAAVEAIVKAFPDLTFLDLSSNANMSSGVMRHISELKKLEQLLLIQTRLNEISTRRLNRLPELKVLDLRGNMEAGNMTMEILGTLPKLKAVKHRSTAVTDQGMEQFARSETIENLLIQDFAISDISGTHLANLKKLSQLEIFRCPGFGSSGVLALKGLGLQRLTLRDLPAVEDDAMEVFQDLPKLRRLYLHELSVGDGGLKQLAHLKSLELLDVWAVPNLSDAAIEAIATLPNLKELSLRSTSITDASIDKILAIPTLETLILKGNGGLSEDALKKLQSKQWKKLDVGAE